MVNLKVQSNNANIQQKPNQSGKYKNVPKAYLDFAKGQERIFANHLIKQMRKGIDKTQQESTAERYYKGLMDDEIAKVISESDSGLGIKDVVLNQIYPQYKDNTKSAQEAYGLKNSNKGLSDE